MSEVNPTATEAGKDLISEASKGAHETGSAATNGHGVPPGTASTEGLAPEAGTRPVLKRAEAMADRLALQVGVFSTLLTEGLKRFVARAREEAEDLWAEAQHIRKGTKS